MTAPLIRHSPRRSVLLGVVALLVALAAGCGTHSAKEAQPAAGPVEPDRLDVVPPTPTVPGAPSVAPIGQRSATLDQLPGNDKVQPVGLRIEGAGIEAPVVGVSADPDSGDLAVPPSPDEIAWYEHGSAPGESGSAVLAAHVDWHGQPGAFFTLASVEVGATVVVTMADGREVRFTVDSREQLAKQDLPRDQIFSRQGPPQLVLVTCGGDFRRSTHQYADNVLVFASLAST